MTTTAQCQPVALTLRSPGVRSDDVLQITWIDLAAADIGREWRVQGGGMMFADLRSATVTWRDDDLIVVAERHHYSETDGRDEEELIIHHFRLTPGVVRVEPPPPN